MKKSNSKKAPANQKAADSNKLLQQGVAMQEQGYIQQAEHLFNQSLLLNPINHLALYSLSVIALGRQELGASLSFLERAVACAPRVGLLWYARGVVLAKEGRRLEALASFETALQLDPRDVEALNHCGAILFDLGRRPEALERFISILSIEPNLQALSNIATIHAESINDVDLVHAITVLAQLVAINPDHEFALGRLTYQKLHICDWSGYQALTQRVLEGVRAGRRSCPPIPTMVMSGEAAEHQQCARSYSGFFFPPSPVPMWRGERYPHSKIRIAYVSPDFREHPVGQLMAGVLERHDRSNFELVAISLLEDDGSPRRARLVKAFDQFIDAHAMDVKEIAALIRSLEIDIAVDLAGYTTSTRSQLFAHRPAPIQVNYLGYAGTLGSEHMDYIVADRQVIPPEHQDFYDEKVAYLPDTYLPTDGELKPAQRTPSREECGLPASGFVFCSFSHDHKISPMVFDIWMRLLLQVPGSVLWLMSRLAVSTRNLRNEAAKRGIDPDRLVFAERLPRMEDHLARYRQADVFLDTYPYNAHTTAADALSLGLPVLTCMGNAFPSRVAGSLLHAIGVPELISHSLADYEAMALRLALQPAELAAIKTKLLANRNTTPLFDTDRYCRNLEAVFKQMFAAHQFNGTFKTDVDPGAVPPAETVKLPDQPPASAPTDHELAMQGIELHEQGKLEAAERLFTACLALNPNNALALYSLGSILLERPDKPAALAFLNNAVQRAPGFAQLWFACGVALAGAHKPEEALASYDRAIALDPNYLAAWINSCLLLNDLNRPQEAQERYSRVMELKRVA